MLTSELVAVLIAVGGVAVVYVAAARVLIEIIRRRRRWGKPLGRWRKAYERTVLALAMVGLLCMAYARFVEPYWIVVTHVTLPTAKLAPDSARFRIVHISDLHSDPTPRLETRLPRIIADQKPDLIVFTGDAVNSPEALPVSRECLKQVAETAPTYAVQGNWEAWYNPVKDGFSGTGVHELNGEPAETRAGNSRVWICGVSAGHENLLASTLRKAPTDALTIFLYHYPDEADAVSKAGIDLYCAGHTHGGQVSLPWYGALVTLSKYGKKYEAGLYRVGKTWLYVNRGIGMEGGHAPRVRFWSRPEVTVIDFVPETGTGRALSQSRN
jgi:uncharacterized protein